MPWVGELEGCAMLLKPTVVAVLALGTLPAVAAAAPRDVAVRYVTEHPDRLGVKRADVADLAITSAYRSSHSDVTHVNVNQHFAGREVFGAHATVNVDRRGRVIFAAGDLVRGLRADPSAAALGPVGAVEAAAGELGLDNPSGLRVLRRRGGAAQVSRGGISDATIPARLGWQPTRTGLRPAWQVTIDDSASDHLWNATVDAATGELLDRADWTSHADGARYRVFEFPKGDPNDGPRTLAVEPADAFASPFGWHDTNGAAGPESTRTLGNNVHAYSDRDANNLPDLGSDPDGGPALTFDFAADHLNEHPQTYPDAAVTNLFYWCNVVHDLTYRYGFDEAAGNFQVNNYGRGGVGGDDVRCEAQDGSGTNNANFSTPAMDGGRPRMQMFLWPGLQLGQPNAVTVAGVAYPANFARFTPAPTSAGVPGTVVAVGDGCAPYSLPAGSIALADTSAACNVHARALNAQNAGAVALVVAHDVAGDPPILSGSMDPAVTIPAISVSQESGAAIKAALPAAGRVHRNLERPPMRDADFRSETIFHEYGHGVSNRLTGGPNVNCLTGNEQAGEGWSDFLAITFLMNPAIDDPEGPRGYGQWALFADSRVGPGFRPRPYSRNMALQPFTYDSIKTGAWLEGTSLALPHGLGHGWAAVLWDMAWDLVEQHGFNPNAYAAWNTGGNNRAIQYVIDGLKLQGCGPGLVVARSAIIAAQEALTGGEDTCTLWAAFARRGLGFSAVQGTTNRDDNEEAFDTHPQCRRAFAAPVTRPYGELHEIDAGDAVALRFTADGQRQLDVLASNSPFSRQVDCATLDVPSSGAAVTPRELPIATQTPGGSRLQVSSNGLYTYPWKTLGPWAGTCREVVVTRDDGRQHRAFFRFT
jgi:extracellular elastinolytic metalloproteinase